MEEKIRLLLADPSENFRAILQELLEENGFEVLASVGDGLAALDAAEVHKSYKYQMWEIEASCANSLREVMLQRLLLSGGVSVHTCLWGAAVSALMTAMPRR